MGIPFQLKDAHLTAISGEKDPDLSEIFSSCLALNEIVDFLKHPAASFQQDARHWTMLLFVQEGYRTLRSVANLPCSHNKQ